MAKVEKFEDLICWQKARELVNLVYFEWCNNRKDAMHRENYLKTTYGKRYIRNRIKNDLMSIGSD